MIKRYIAVKVWNVAAHLRSFNVNSKIAKILVQLFFSLQENKVR